MAIDLSGGLDPAREQVFPSPPARAGTRDAVNVWLEDDAASLGMRIGVEATAPDWGAHEIWLDIAFAEGRVLSLRDKGAAHDPRGPEGLPTVLGAGPLRFRCLEPFRKWHVAFDGTAHETNARELIDQSMPADLSARATSVKFEIEMNMAVPPWVPGSLLPEAGAILRGGEQGEFMSPRYEQLFRAAGWLEIAGGRRDLRANGLRIRRQGYRKFEGFWGHCWQSALFPDGRAFGFNIYPPRPDQPPSYAEGFVFEGDGALRPAQVVEVPWLTRLLPGGERVALVLQTAQGRVAIDGVSFVNTRSRSRAILPKNFPIVQQAHVKYVWDGQETVGMMERSSTLDKFSLR